MGSLESTSTGSSRNGSDLMCLELQEELPTSLFHILMNNMKTVLSVKLDQFFPVSTFSNSFVILVWLFTPLCVFLVLHYQYLSSELNVQKERKTHSF